MTLPPLALRCAFRCLIFIVIGLLGAVAQPYPGPVSLEPAQQLLLERGVVNLYTVAPTSDGGAFVGGDFHRIAGQQRNYFAHLKADGTLDEAFPATGMFNGHGSVYAVLLQSDGKLIVGGAFRLSGDRNNLVRLNADGSVDGTFVTAYTSGAVRSIRPLPNGRLLIAGDFSSVRSNGSFITRYRVAILNADGSLDTTFVPPPSVGLTVWDAIPVAGGGYLMAGELSTVDGVATSGVVKLTATGAVDSTFAAAGKFPIGPRVVVYSMAEQSDGRIILGGGFSSFAGQTVSNLLRIDASGVLDPTFGAALGTVNSEVGKVQVDASDNVWIAGAFTTIGGVSQPRVAKLLSTGALDTAVTPDVLARVSYGRALAVQGDGNVWIAGANVFGQDSPIARFKASDGADVASATPVMRQLGTVNAITKTTDGTVWLGGDFHYVDGQSADGLVRLASDGSVAQWADLGWTNPGWVNALLPTSDGGLLVGGSFYGSSGAGSGNVANLLKVSADHSLDSDFATNSGSASYAGGVTGAVARLAKAPADGFYLYGDFTSVQGQSRPTFARMQANGQLDASFNAAGSAPGSYQVRTMVSDATGRVYLGGYFTSVAGVSRANLVRFDATGAVDAAFQPLSLSGSVWDILIDSQGRVVVGGDFSSVGSNSAARVARFLVDGTFDATLTSAANIGFGVQAMTAQADGKLLLAGSFTTSVSEVDSPYLLRINADGTLDGTFAALNLGGTIAKLVQRDDGGLVVGGDTANGVNVGLMTAATAPAIVVAPTAQTGTEGGDVTFTAAVTGASPLNFEWRRDGVVIAGADGPSLTLTNIDYRDLGDYRLTVSNPLGEVSTTTVALTSGDALPVITGQPQDQTIGAGLNGTLSVGTTGANLTYQWRRNGIPIPGATGASRIITDASIVDEGLYDVIVINGLSSVVSDQASVRVNPTQHPGAVTADLANEPMLEVYAAVVRAIVPLPDGRTYVAGEFSYAHGTKTGPVFRLLADGTLDPNFRVSGIKGDVVTGLVVQADGKVVIGGVFNASTGANHLVRLNADGSLDPTFLSKGMNSNVTSLNATTDGRLMVGGFFTAYFASNNNTIPRQGFAVLNGDGTLDTSVNPPTFNQGGPKVARHLADGGFLLGGSFTQVGGAAHKSLARLNADGSWDPTFASAGGLNGVSFPSVEDIEQSATGSIVVTGSFNNFSGQTVSNVVRLSTGGVLDSDFSTNLGTVSSTVNQVVEEPDGALVISGGFTQINSANRRRIARLAANGALAAEIPTSVVETAAIGPGALARGPDGKLWLGTLSMGAEDWNVVRIDSTTGDRGTFALLRTRRAGEVLSSLLMPGGDVLVGGRFDAVDGERSTGLVQLAADGSVSRRFDLDPNTTNYTINALMRQGNGSVLVGGNFITRGNVAGSGNYLVRLRPDGTLDPSFGTARNAPGYVYGLNGGVRDLAQAPDGSFVAVGDFSSVENQPRSKIARFDVDGHLDDSFIVNAPGLSFGAFTSTVIDRQGRVYVGGGFSSIDGQTREGVVRLLATGAVDLTFGNLQLLNGVRDVVLDDSGRLLVAGSFSSALGGYAPRVARFNDDGSRDTHFTTAGNVGYDAQALYVQADGKVLVAGSFSFVSGAVNSPYLVRLNDDGSRDETFTALNFGHTLTTITQRDDGQLFTGGSISTVAGFAVAASAPSIATQPQDVAATAGGDATFTVAADGTGPLSYEWYRDGTLIAGATGSSLALSGVTVADIADYHVRISNALGSVISDVAELVPSDLEPTIVQQPADLLATVGDAAAMAVVATPGAEVSYQWYRNGQPVAGATMAALNLSGVSLADAGFYRVQVINGLAAAWSDAAELSVTPAHVPGLLVADPNGLLLERDFAQVNVIHPLAGGGALIAGQIDTVNSMKRGVVVRVAADGTLVDSFASSPRLTGTVTSLVVQSDGRIVVAGNLQLDGVGQYIARLTPNGALDESFRGRANNQVDDLVLLPNDRIPAVGFFSSLRNPAGLMVARRYVAVLEADGSLDESFIDPNRSGNATAVLLMSDGDLLVGGGFTTVGGVARRGLVKMDTAGVVDSTFAAGGGFDASGFFQVNRLGQQPNGGIIVAGVSSSGSYGGVAVSQCLRLNANGTLDATFSSALSGLSGVQRIATDASNGVWLAGTFSAAAGQSRPGVVHFGADGVLDPNFVPSFATVPNSRYGLAPMTDGTVWVGGSSSGREGLRIVRLASATGSALVSDFPALRTMGSPTVAVPTPGNGMLVAGSFDLAGGQRTDSLVRLGADGAVAESYDLGFSFSGSINGLVRQTDGSIVAAGSFTFIAPGGASVRSFLRIKPDGTVDPTFGPAAGAYSTNGSINGIVETSEGKLVVYGSPSLSQGSMFRSNVVRFGPDGSPDWALDVANSVVSGGSIQAMAVDELGRIYVGGTFTTVSGTAMTRLARLLPTGALDTSFANPNIDSTVNALALDGQGRLLVGGFFSSVGGATQRIVARLLSGGGRDTEFTSAANLSGRASQFIVQADGKVLVVGSFSAMAGSIVSPQLVRLNADGSRDESLVAWQVQGTGGTLAQRDDGALFVGGFTPTRTGFLLAGALPEVDTTPLAQVAAAGDNVTFSVGAMGSGPLAYQWFHDGVAIAGANSSSLELSAVTGADRGAYAVEVRNGFGVIRSEAATLSGAASVPVVTISPATVNATVGDDVVLSLVSDSSTATYQWRRNGFPIDGATGATLTLDDVRLADADRFDVLVNDGPSLSLTQTAAALVRVFPATFATAVELDPHWQVTFEDGDSSALRSISSIFPLPDGGALVGGRFVEFEGHRTRDYARVNAARTIDRSFVAPAFSIAGNSATVFRTVMQGSDHIVSVSSPTGFYVDDGSPVTLRRFDLHGAADETFVMDPALRTSFEDEFISGIAADAGGRIYVMWERPSTEGTPETHTLTRLTVNGSWDTAFPAHTFTGWLSGMVVQVDGDVLVGGAFSSHNGAATAPLVRIDEATGAIDTAFAGNLSFPAYAGTADVWPLFTETDGTIYLAGRWSENGSSVQLGIFDRLASDGSLVARHTTDGSVFRAAVLADGTIVLGGFFQEVDDVAAPYMAAISPAGVVSARSVNAENYSFQSFEPNVDGSKAWIMGYDYAVGRSRVHVMDLPSGAVSEWTPGFCGMGLVTDLERLDNDEWLAVGDFATVNGQPSANMVRLSAAGEVVGTYGEEWGPQAYVLKMERRSDGKINVLGGPLTDTLTDIRRLNSDGTLDPTFVSPVRNGNEKLLLQPLPGGKTLLTSWFLGFDNGVLITSRRLLDDGSIDPTYPAQTVSETPAYTGLVQRDGSVIYGTYASTTRLKRFGPNGEFDPTFFANSGITSSVLDLEEGYDESVWVFGWGELDRLDMDGNPLASPSVDETFVNWAYWIMVPQPQAIALPDGDMLFAGFWSLRINDTGVDIPVVRLNPDLSWDDTGFSIRGIHDPVTAMALVDDGDLLVAVPGALSRTRPVGEFSPFVEADTEAAILAVGGTVELRVGDLPSGALSLQWRRNGEAIPGASGATLLLSDLRLDQAGDYDVVITGSFGERISTALALNVEVVTPAVTVFSARAEVGAGQVAVLPFRIEGAGQKKVLLRAVGPSLASFGVTGTMAQPRLELLDHVGARIAENSGWNDDSAVAAIGHQFGAIPLGTGSEDAALVAQLAEGNYALRVGSGLGGVVLIELWDADDAGSNRRLVQAGLWSNADVTGQSFVAGFVSNRAGAELLIRAVGPGTGLFDAAADPSFELFQSNNSLAVGDDWDGSTNLRDAMAQAGATPLLSGSGDAAESLMLQPGAYSVVVRSEDTLGAGVLFEVFDLRARAPARLPVVLIAPVAKRVVVGGATYFEVMAAGETPMSYQWLHNGSPIPGETGAVLLLADLTTDDAGPYEVRISNSAGSVVTAPAELVVGGTPRIVRQPVDPTVRSGDGVTLRVEAESSTDAPQFQWYEGESGDVSMPIEGATTSTYSTAPLATTSSFWVSVSNDFGAAFSETATITVLPDSPNYGTHAVVGAGYVPGQHVTVTTSFTYEGALGSLAWSVQLPEGWSFVSTDGEEHPDVRPKAGDTGLVGWEYTSLPVSPVSFSYTLLAPPEQTGVVSLAGVVLFTPSGQTAQQIVLTPGPLQLEQRPAVHAADTDGDGRIGLSELLRVIELYNTRFGTTRTGLYRLSAGTTDGFGSDTSSDGAEPPSLSRYHSADYNRDGKLGLSELLRVIELYNTRSGTTRTGAYRIDSTAVDGFAPGDGT